MWVLLPGIGFSFINTINFIRECMGKAKSKVDCLLSLVPITLLLVTGTFALSEENGYLSYIYLSLGFVFNTITIKTILCSMADRKLELFHMELFYLMALTAVMKYADFEEKLASNIWIGSSVFLFIYLMAFSIKLLREIADGLGIKILF